MEVLEELKYCQLYSLRKSKGYPLFYHHPLHGFIKDNITLKGKITLVVEMEEPSPNKFELHGILDGGQHFSLLWGARKTCFKGLGSPHLYPPLMHNILD